MSRAERPLNGGPIAPGSGAALPVQWESKEVVA
ncbi:MAG: hypothetical protein QOH26_692, partial [Actinomycetota bacterium]|nr:hypothetical protein [Actinomycetota bacterium]